MFRASVVLVSVTLALFASPFSAYAWDRVGPLSGSVSNVRIHPSNSQIIYFINYQPSAVLYRTLDGGATTSVVSIPDYIVKFDPVSPNVIYGYWGALHKTTNGGSSWGQITTFYVSELAIDPSNSNRLFAATDQLGQVQFSSNGGASWTPLAQVSAFTYVAALAVSPTNGNVIYAGMDSWQDFGSDGIFKTTNGGASWANITGPLFHGNISSIAIDPFNSAVVYAATAGTLASSGSGIHKSVDGGATWVQSGFPNGFVSEIAVDPVHANRVYALTNQPGRFYVSNDAGATWNVVTTPLASITDDFDLFRANPDVLCLAVGTVAVGTTSAGFEDFGVTPADMTAVLVDRTNGDVVYATGRGRYKSDDGALQWEAVGTTAFGEAIVQDPADPAILYNGAYSGGGIQKSTDSGANWLTVFASKSITDISIAATNPSVVYASGLYQPGFGQPHKKAIFKSVDAGGTWSTQDNSFHETIEVHPANDAIVYAGGADGVSKSIDGGATWTPVTNGLNNPASGVVREIVIDPTNPEIVYSAPASHGVYKSIDGGAQWTRLTFSMTDVRAMAIDPEDAQIVYAASWAQGIFVSVDGGQNWNAIGGSISGSQDVTVDPTDRNRLYTAGGGVWRFVRTTSAAVPVIESHEPGIVVQSNCPSGCELTFDISTPDDYSGVAVLGLERKIGDMWIQDDALAGPLSAPAWQLNRTVQPTDEPGEYVFRAVMRRADGARAVSNEVTVTVFEAPTGVPQTPALAFDLEQNRPNPFNPSTTIAFELPATARARLAIYNVRGDLVTMLLDRAMPSGKSEVAWNGRDSKGRPVGSGVYFYRLSAGDKTMTRRMVLLK